MKTYHVGLLQKGSKAVFQFRSSKDELSCEILEYFGVRETTKAAARMRLQNVKNEVLFQLQKNWPHRKFTSVVMN